MLNNLILYFVYTYGNDTLLYFTKSVKKEVKDNKQDSTNNRVVCMTDLYLEEEEEDVLGFQEAKSFIDSQKKLIAQAKNSIIYGLSVGVTNLE